MAYSKTTFANNSGPAIDADFLNNLQDEVIRVAGQADSPKALSTAISETVRALYGLSVDNANVDKALQIAPNNIKGTIKEIRSSQVYTVPSGVNYIDVFLVGGGGAGGLSYGGNNSGGGGGGYTSTVWRIPVTAGAQFNCVIGAGGIPSNAMGFGAGNGGRTSFGQYTVNGGTRGRDRDSDDNRGMGGSGGSQEIGINGGFDGSNYGESFKHSSGTGQHSSTSCPFNGVLYSGGGGFGAYHSTPITSLGGAGGGGNGGNASIPPQNGTPNTGGGGGGGNNDYQGGFDRGGYGGSGIIVIRERRW